MEIVRQSGEERTIEGVQTTDSNFGVGDGKVTIVGDLVDSETRDIEDGKVAISITTERGERTTAVLDGDQLVKEVQSVCNP